VAMIRAFDEEVVEKIREDYEAGMTMAKLAEKYFCGKGTIERVVNKKGAYSKKG
jgi:Mor family transcriptional regulator